MSFARTLCDVVRDWAFYNLDGAHFLTSQPLNRTHAWRSSMVNVAFIAAKSAYHLEDDSLTEEARNTTISNLLHFDKSYAYTFAPKLDGQGKEVDILCLITLLV